MNRNLSVDLMVGLFVVLGFCALVFLALRAGNMNSAIGLGDTYEVKARFDNIGGLKPRAAVRSAGVVVGRVTAIRFNDKARSVEVKGGVWLLCSDSNLRGRCEYVDRTVRNLGDINLSANISSAKSPASIRLANSTSCSAFSSATLPICLR